MRTSPYCRLMLLLIGLLNMFQQAYGASPLTIGTSGNLGTYPIGTDQIVLSASGGSGSYTWSVTAGALPPGLNIAPAPFTANNPTAIVGVATTTGTYNFTLAVNDGSQTVSQPASMKITALTLKDTYNLPDGFYNQSYSYSFTALNNAGTPTFAANGTLPAGLTLSAAGVLSGTVMPGGYNINLSVSDGVDTTYKGYHLQVYGVYISASTTLPNGNANSSYNQVLSAVGGTGSVTFSGGGGLPPGLSLASTGAIFGSISSGAGGKYSFNATVTDGANNSFTRNFTLDVIAAVPLPMRIYPYGTANTFDDAVVGNNYSTGIGLCCGGTAPYRWAVSGLPAGMSLRTTGVSNYIGAQEAEIWGTPSVPGVYTLQVTVTDSLGATVTDNLPLKVTTIDIANGLAGGTLGTAYNQLLWVVGGKPAYAVSSIYGSLPAGLTQTSPGAGSGFAVTGTPAENGGFQLIDRVTDANGTTLTRTLYSNIGNVGNSGISINNSGNLGTATLGSYSVQLSACCVGTTVWTIVGGTIPPGLSLSAGGLLSGSTNVSGTYTFLVKAADAMNAANPGYRQFSLTVSPISISTGGLPYGNVGTAYSTTLAATGGTGALTWTQGPGTAYLPPGLLLNSNGTITGTPQYAGRFDGNITVTDANGNSNQRYFTITIYPAGAFPPVQITTNSNLGTWNTGTQQIALSGSGGSGAYTWSLVSGTLPPGLALRTDVPSFFNSNSQAGLIGVATTPGTYNFTLSVASGGQTVTQAFTVRVTPLQVMENVGASDAFVGTPYSFQFTPVGNAGPVTFSGRTMPAGLSISSTGLLSGTPTSAGSPNVNFTISDGVDTVTISYTLPVHAINITSPQALSNVTQYGTYNQTLTATGGAGGYTFTVGCCLPGGLGLNANTGAITGTTNAGPGLYSFYVTATDTNHVSYSKLMYIDVVGNPPSLPRVDWTIPDDATLGNHYTWGLYTCCGGVAPFTWTATGLPPGMGVRSGTAISNYSGAHGELYGIPQPGSAGSYTPRITITDATGAAASMDIPFRVSNLDFQYTTPAGFVGSPYSETFRLLGGTASYNAAMVDGFLPAGLTVNSTPPSITGTPLENSGQNPVLQFSDSTTPAPNTLRKNVFVNVIGGNGSTISINGSGSYGYLLYATSGSFYSTTFSACCIPAYTWNLAGGSLPPGLTFTTGGLLSGTPNTPGVYTFRISASDPNNATNVAYRQYMFTVSPLSFTTSSLPYANVGSGYSASVAVTGGTGAVNYSIVYDTALPTGLSLNAATGAITGTPAISGSTFFSVLATDSTGAPNLRGFTINVYPASTLPPLALSFGPTLNATVGQFNQQLNATGGMAPYHYSATPGAPAIPGFRVLDGQPLPNGYNAANGTGSFAGVSTQPGTWSSSIRVTDAMNRTFDWPFTLVANPLVIFTQASTITKATVGVPYSYQLQPGGGTGSYIFTSNNLPPGISLNSSTGLLSGTPTTAGTFGFSVTLGNTSVSGTIGFGFTLIVNAFAITNAPILPQGSVNTPYSQTFSAPGCGTSCAWTLVSGFPSGFAINASTGVLTGTVTSTSGYFGTGTVQVTGSNGTVQKVFTLIIPPTLISAPVINTSFSTSNPVGGVYANSLSASGGTPPYTWAVTAGNLPTGITIPAVAGENLGYNLAPGFYYLYGRPTQVGTYSFTLQVTDANNRTATKALSWQISPLQLNYGSLPVNGANLVFGQAYQQNILVLGGSGNYTSWVNTLAPAAIYPGLTMNASTGLVSGTPTNTGFLSSPIQVTDDAGNSLVQNLNINVTSNATTTVTISGGPGNGAVFGENAGTLYTLTGSGGTGPYTITAAGSLPSGFALLSGNSSPTAGTTYLQVSPTIAGPYSFTLQITDANGVTGARTFTGTVADFPYANTTLPDATVNSPYSQTVYLGSGPSFTLASGSVLPAGLSLSAAGVISGTPTASGTYQFSIVQGDASGSVTYSLTLNVTGLAFTTATVLPNAIFGVAYSVQLQATGGTNLTWSAASLPSGLTLSPSGLLSGTPTATYGPFSLVVTVSGGGMTLKRTYSLFVLNSATTILSVAAPNPFTGLQDATLNGVYTTGFAISGGTPPYTVALAAGAVLPPGLTIVPTNPIGGSAPSVPALVGVPTVAGNYSFATVITDSAGNQTTHTYKLNVTPLVFNSQGVPSAIAGQPYSHQIPTIGGTAPYTFAIYPINNFNELLPPGLSVSASGLISGTPLSTGNFSFYITAQDGAGHSRFTSMTLLSTNANNLYVTSGNSAGLVGNAVNQTLATSGSSTYTWSVTAGTLPPGVSLQGNKLTGYLTAVSPATPVASFTSPFIPKGYQFLVRATDTTNSANFAERWITISATPIQLVTPAERDVNATLFLPDAKAGTPYSFTFKAAGGTPPYTYSEHPFYGIPQGLTLSSNGVLSGTPADSGLFNIRVIVTDSTGEFRIGNSMQLPVGTATGNPPFLAVPNNAFIPSGSLGQPFSFPLKDLVTGGMAPIAWSLSSGSLPTGLSIANGPAGVSSWIVGTPTAPGQSSFTLVATDAAGQTVSIPASFGIASLNLSGSFPSGTVGSAYSTSFTASGGTGPYTLQYAPGNAQIPGLTLGGGMLSGTPLYSGLYPFGLLLTDSANNSTYLFGSLCFDDAAGQSPCVGASPNPINLVYTTGSPNVSLPLIVSSTSGSVPYKAGLLGLPAAASISANSGASSATPSLTLNINGATASPGTYTGVLALNDSQASNNWLGVPVSLTVIAPPPCTYTISPGSSSALATGGSGSFNVSAGNGCSWTAAPDSSSSWVSVTGASTASGNGTVGYTVAANTASAQRTGTITVANQTYSITQFGQSCSFAISPSSLNLTNTGGQITVNVTSSGASCAWPASSGLGVVTPTPAAGNGQVQITVPPNTGAATASLAATIAGQPLTVTESGANCNFALSSGNASFSSTGGQGVVTISGPPGCAYSTVTGPGWVLLTSGGSGTLDASGQTLVTYSVAGGSTTLGRSATLLIGGQPYQISESGLACSISLDASGLGVPFGTSAGTAVINVTANGSNCQWNASSNTSFVTVSPTAGSGNGAVNVTVTSNASSTAARNGSVSVGGQTVNFAQAGTTCNFSLRSAIGSVPAAGGTGAVSVVAPSACSWTAVSNVPWVAVTAGSSAGTAEVQFTVQPSTSATPQTGTLTIAGQTFTVTQQAASCSFTLGSASASFANTTNSGSLTYTTAQSGCSVTPLSFANWLTILPASSFAGSTGTLSYSVAANPSSQTRTGSVQIGDKVYTVTQSGAACAFSLSSYGASFNSLGGAGIVLGTANVATGCNPNPSVNLPFVLLNGAAANINTYTFTQGFTVTPFATPVITTRRGLINFGNQLFAIKQTSY